jgi:hypothetical protein
MLPALRATATADISHAEQSAVEETAREAKIRSKSCLLSTAHICR